MNILLLSNSAPNYFHFFNALAQEFQRDGHPVVVAVDSTFSRRENHLDGAGFVAVEEFQGFFIHHQTNPEILRRYAGFNLNAALLSDFERAEVYGIWGKAVDPDWFDRLKSALLSFYEGIFDRHKIDMVLYENVSNALEHFALFVAQARGARYCGLAGSRLPGRFAVVGDPLADTETAENFARIRAGTQPVSAEERAWAYDYIAGIDTVVPDYMKTNQLDRIGIVKRYIRRGRLKKVRALLRHWSDTATDAFQIGNPLHTHARLFARNVARRLRASRVRNLYDPVPEGETFLLYPLHFHPEAATSILAGAYLDEYEVIRNIAFNLPEGTRLYVKDHLSAWAYPSMRFYRRIKQLPNVRLLAPTEPTKTLIRNSAAVITLTSTVGYEALLLKKRVLLYGKVFYDFHTGVTRITDPARLHELISEVLAQPVDWDHTYDCDMVCAYRAATLPSTLNLLQEGEPAQKLAQQIYPVLRGAIGLSV